MTMTDLHKTMQIVNCKLTDYVCMYVCTKVLDKWDGMNNIKVIVIVIVRLSRPMNRQ